MAKKKKADVVLTPEQQTEADYQKAVRRMEGAGRMLQTQDQIHMYKEAIRMFDELGDYADSPKRKQECRKCIPALREKHREDIYREGRRLMENAVTPADYDEAVAQFQRLRHEYKDIPELIELCRERKRHEQIRRKKRKALYGLTAVAAVAVLIGMVFYLRTPPAFYAEGRILMGIGDYERARNVFVHSAGYRDTDRRLLECNYQRALNCEKSGDYEKAVRILRSVGSYRDAMERKAGLEQNLYSAAARGDKVPFGNVSWIVAEKKDDMALLVRRSPAYVSQVYKASGNSATWADSDLRQWLNGKFYNNCFTENEQGLIMESDVATAANSRYGTQGGETVRDSVFLLDESQAKQYREILTLSGNQKAWWLRTPGKSADSAAYVSADGRVMPYGYAVDSAELAVRPAVWVRCAMEE